MKGLGGIALLLIIPTSCPVFDRGRGFRAGNDPDCPSSHWVEPLRLLHFTPQEAEESMPICVITIMACRLFPQVIT